MARWATDLRHGSASSPTLFPSLPKEVGDFEWCLAGALTWCQHLRCTTSTKLLTQSTSSSTHLCTIHIVCTGRTNWTISYNHPTIHNYHCPAGFFLFYTLSLVDCIRDQGAMSASNRARVLLGSNPSRAAQWTRGATFQRLPLAASLMGERRFYAVNSGTRARMSCALGNEKNARALRISSRRGYAKSVASDTSDVSETSSSTSESDVSSQSSFGNVEETTSPWSPEFGFAFE